MEEVLVSKVMMAALVRSLEAISWVNLRVQRCFADNVRLLRLRYMFTHTDASLALTKLMADGLKQHLVALGIERRASPASGPCQALHSAIVQEVRT